jgi:hypothetical protein
MSVAPEGIEELPFGLQRERHIEVRAHTPWIRRAGITLMTAFCVLALANTFGQVATVTSGATSTASLKVESPTRLRGGLIFTSVFTVVAAQKIADARLRLSPGWFNGITLNASAPQSNQQSSDSAGTTMDFGSVDAGSEMPVWISWQVNPTTVGGRDQDVTLWDGDKQILSLHRSVFVFP